MAVPVGFALIRALKTGTDFRSVWMLAVSLAAAAVITRTWRLGRSAVLFFGIVLVTCTVLSAGTAYILGASAAFGVWAVALAFGVCIAAASTLYQLANSEG